MLMITVKVDGMMCGMCESHINDAVRNNFPVKKVDSSRKKGETHIITEQPISEDKLRSVISELGYAVSDIKTEEYEKKGFSLFGKR